MEENYTSVTELPGNKGSKEQLARLYQRYHFALQFSKEKDVLEVACGGGLGLGYLAKSAKFGSSGDERLWVLHPLVKTKLNITSETVNEVKSELDKKREEINMFLESIE